MADVNVTNPFGVAETIVLSATGNQAVIIKNDITILDGASTIATGNRTLIATLSAQLKIGAKILLKAKTTGTETTIFSTGFVAPTITGVAGKIKTQGFIFDGTNFLPTGASLQID